MMKVLIVDDEQFVRVSLRTLYNWEDNGFEIIGTADDGIDALEKIEKYEPDIVITDIAMPNMDGLALLEEINARRISCVSLVISNLNDFQNVKAALKLGAADYFLKVDFERDEFHAVMQSLKKIAYQKKSEQLPRPASRPANTSLAELLAASLSSGDFSALSYDGALHVFCIRIKKYMSETLSSFQSVYRSLGNIVEETFKAKPSVSYARGPEQDTLLVTVPDEIPATDIMDMIKRLDGQTQVYLQARADILHFSNAVTNDNSALFEKLSSLSSYFSQAGQPQLLWDENDSGISNHEKDDIDLAIRYIGDNLGRYLSLTELADYVGLNPSYLSRVFKQKTGVSVVQYITEQKMKRAALLLRSGNYRVKEVATLLGVEDQYYFTKLFSKVYHMSPLEYMADANGEDE